MSIYQKLFRSILFRLPPEAAHELGIAALKLGGEIFGRGIDDPTQFGEIRRFGQNFANPIGAAAGFDKNGVVVDQLAGLGFGHVEVGTVTFTPQPGNPKPRLFRLPDDNALINRMGFNNDGAAAVAGRLAKLERRCVVGVNIGKNREVPIAEATENYLRCFETVHPVADYIAVNISSPNTPNLRDLQRPESLEGLIGQLQTRNSELGRRPLLVKISPDLTEAEIESAVDVCLRTGVDGMIATNTTISRVGLRTADVASIGAGGLSGRPLAARSNEVIAAIFRYSKGKMPIIGVGGIFTPEDAFDKIAAGACLLQAYTGFIYSGQRFAREINKGLSDILDDRGFASLDEAVGSSTG